MGELRERKKRETRQRISDVATELFFARGFDHVTLDEVAQAANVSKMTVLNYFERKEDLILDLEDELKFGPFRRAIRERPKGQSPVDALRKLVKELAAEKSTLSHIDERVVGWWRVVRASPALRARLRELADEAAEGLALELGGPEPSGKARLMAGAIVLTVRTALDEAIRLIENGASTKRANAALLSLVERGFVAVESIV